MAANTANDAAVLVQLDFGNSGFEERLSEFHLLALSAGITPVEAISGKRARPDAATFAGKGKVVQIADTARRHDVSVVIFNHELSPGQQRNLERELQCRVIDRSSLILDIFAQRARSHEGKLQVELAQLQHLATRLVRGWTHLERQKGGIGLRGPGEKQLETDRRLLGKRVALLKEKLKALGRQRTVRRRARERSEVLTVSVVGYTNAGKSTLFNALTNAGAYAADQLFATLDTTSRRLFVEGAGHIVISDTVGFIGDLPHELVAAFQATLEETAQADLLLHVVDSACTDRDQQISAVDAVLTDIGAGNVAQVIVWNKIDVSSAIAGVALNEHGKIARIRVSAKTGEGLELLRETIADIAREKASPKLVECEPVPDTAAA